MDWAPLLDFSARRIHRDPYVMTLPERPFSGLQVSLLGKLSVLSKRDVRAVVERLGGTFSPDLTARTAVVVAAGDLPEPRPSARVMSESELCVTAGLPDLETLRSQYYSPRDLRGMYPAIKDEHLRYLEKWGLVRPVIGRYSFADVHVVRQAAAEIERGVALPGAAACALIRARRATGIRLPGSCRAHGRARGVAAGPPVAAGHAGGSRSRERSGRGQPRPRGQIFSRRFTT